jgi:repressor of nif and glnA expression
MCNELTKNDIAVGQIVVYETHNGTLGSVRITDICETTFDGILLRTNGNSIPGFEVWGYVNQIVQTY